MSDYIERTQCGEVFAELSASTADMVQVRLGQTESGELFQTQLCAADGVFNAIEETSEIAITVYKPTRIQDFAMALRWLADTLDARVPPKGGSKSLGPRLAR